MQPAVGGMPTPPAAPPGYYAPAYGDSGRYVNPGVVVSTPPGPPAYVTPPVTVIEYQGGYPYRPRYNDRYWR